MTSRTAGGFSQAQVRLCAATTLGLLCAVALMCALDPRAFLVAPAAAGPGCSSMVVSSDADNGAGTLREKVAGASSGGIVEFCSTLAYATITLTTQIVVTQTNITIDGAGAPGLSVSGNGGATRLFTTTAAIGTLTLENITLTQGVATPSNDYDGGALNVRGALVLSNTTLVDNGAKGSGGGAYVTGTLTLTAAQFLSNTSVAGSGGGAYAEGAATLSGGLFQNNSDHVGSGGGIYANSTLVLTGTRFLGNTASGSGGGAYANGAAALDAGWFQDNQSWSGQGGGFYAFNTLVLMDTTFLSNTASAGGGGAFAGAATLSGGLFERNNSTGSDGGGLRAGTLVLTGTRFLSNTASFFGGGAYAAGVVTLNGGIFQNNQCTTDNCYGGGLYASSSLALTDTQFLGNVAAAGGGIYQFYPTIGTNRLVNGLFARNVATGTNGAALYLGSGGGVQILHSTIASPTLASGSAIYIGAGTVGITDTIVASYSIGISNTGGTVYEDYDLFFGDTISRTGTISGGAHDVFGNPAFVNPAADNYHLSQGSAAVDSGTNAGVTFDVDGDRRPIGNGFDIGYDEALLRLFLPLIRR